MGAKFGACFIEENLGTEDHKKMVIRISIPIYSYVL